MSTVNGREDFQAWISMIGDDLPNLEHVRQLVEMIESNETPRIVICGRGGNISVDVIRQLNELSEVVQFNDQFKLHLLADERRYMLLEPDLIPLRQDPFWAQQGKRTKGKRGRY